MNKDRKRIAISAGEPSSISTEISIKALKYLENDINTDFFLVTDPKLVEQTATSLKYKININILKNRFKLLNFKKNSINILPIKLKKKVVPGKLEVDNCDFVVNSLIKCINLIYDGFSHAIVTNPINKYIMLKSGFKYSGHTEFLGQHSRINKNPIMLLTSDKLKVVPLTTHIPLSKVSEQISKEFITFKLRVIHNEIEERFNLHKPRIFVSGINPHAGDNGEIGNEEINHIKPAIECLQIEGLNVSGPYPADTLFNDRTRARYDVAVCMYHDQALIPVKSLSFQEVVNVTLGIDFIRTSPDHGTALDIAGKNLANYKSLLKAIEMAKILIK